MEISTHLKTFEFELLRKNYRKQSVVNYVSCVTKFLYNFKEKDSVKHINEDDIKQFLFSFKEANTQRAYHSAIKTFYKYVCNQPNKFKWIEYAKRNRRLPIVHSQEEIQKLFSACSNLKHKAILSVMYGCGLRVSEVINLKIENIDSSRMVINIINAKGGKDRQVCLPISLLDILRNYYKACKPVDYLFNGQNSAQYTARSIAQFLKMYSEKAGLNKRIYPHLIRHDALTHLLESGTDLAVIQRLAGHGNIKATIGYTHISHNIISRINSPLNQIQCR